MKLSMSLGAAIFLMLFASGASAEDSMAAEPVSLSIAKAVANANEVELKKAWNGRIVQVSIQPYVQSKDITAQDFIEITENCNLSSKSENLRGNRASFYWKCPTTRDPNDECRYKIVWADLGVKHEFGPNEALYVLPEFSGFDSQKCGKPDIQGPN